MSDVYPFTLAVLGLALTYLAGRRARHRILPGHCPCGYDLRGNPSASTCPECGAAIDQAPQLDGSTGNTTP